MSTNEYMRQYMLARYHKRREEAIALLGGRCTKCGSTDDLEFDHVDPTIKSFTIANELAGIAEEKLQEELLKCQLLCTDCHTEKTVKSLVVPHGGGKIGTSTKRQRCKCEACRSAYNTYMREWKRKKRASVR